MDLFRTGAMIVAVLMSITTASAQIGKQIESLRIEQGELSVQFRDNSQSPGVLSGIDALFNIAHSDEFDAYDPDTQGASAGLNFEHIISGHATPNNKFTPRQGRYTLHQLPDGKSVILVRRAEDSPWKVASTLKYTVNEPHYVDFEFRCTPQDASLFAPHNYAIFFFANYMNDVQDVSLHFRGREARDAKESWISADAPKGHPDWSGGGNYRAYPAHDLEYDDNVEFSLNTWTYDWPRISRPFYFGRAAHDMCLTLMFDRLYSEQDQIRFSLYKFKLPKHPRPAWDFQYVINEVRSGVEYGFRGRMVWKKFVSAEDCHDEYERWNAGRDSELSRLPKEQIERLKQLGATVFTRGNEVIEVNANRTQITDNNLAQISGFSQLTDLSLEETSVGDAGLARLRNLQSLEWLNLYRTRIGDDGLKELKGLKRLQHLPIGETLVTDDGLAHLADMKQLLYLGLRGNNVTDAGVKHLRQLTGLTGLHLGGTRITDAALHHLAEMSSLQDLWLDDTAVSDKCVAVIAKLKSLRELHIVDTLMTPESLRQLTVLLPRCRIVH
jgi:hypothetical protein